VLIYNIFCYCMAPGILALVPLAGPPVAIVWIICLLIYAATERLYVRTIGAVVCSLIVSLSALAVTAAVVYAAWKVSGWTIGYAWQPLAPRSPRTW